MSRKDIIKTILIIVFTIAALVVSLIMFYQMVILILKVLIGVSIFFVFILGSSKK